MGIPVKIVKFLQSKYNVQNCRNGWFLLCGSLYIFVPKDSGKKYALYQYFYKLADNIFKKK